MTALDFEDFATGMVEAGSTRIFARWGGAGRPLLLLHGFPETHLMWRSIAPILARDHFVVCADLRGYGASECPSSDPAHEAYSKRAMARDMVEMMASLGHPRFAVAGHDRGGRVAYRLALDHPGRCACLAVLDVLPVSEAWDRADARLALGYWPWSLLALEHSLPELVLQRLARAVVDAAFDGWGSAPEAFPEEVRKAYAQALEDPAHARAICEEYRAAATTDRWHDELDRAGDRRITCPVTPLWSSRGPLGQWYADAGGPLGIWRRWATQVTGQAVEAGHFFPEELLRQTAQMLTRSVSAATW